MATEPGTRTVPALTGLVLCGGDSVRLGRDKALAPVGGTALIDRVVTRLRPVCATVLLAVGDDPGRLADRADGVVLDDPPGAGPLAGIAAGLAAAPGELVAVCGVDHPDIAPSLLVELGWLAHGRDAAVPVVDGWPQTLHAVWARRALPAVRRCLAEGRRSVRGALGALDWMAVERDVWQAHDPGARFAADVDTPDQLAAADRGAAEGPLPAPEEPGAPPGRRGPRAR